MSLILASHDDAARSNQHFYNVFIKPFELIPFLPKVSLPELPLFKQSFFIFHHFPLMFIQLCLFYYPLKFELNIHREGLQCRH